jgi:hypothetical protein
MEAAMRRKTFLATLTGVCVASALVVGAAGSQTASGKETLGSVKISRAVMADGKPLAAGTYTVRLTGETPQAVIGQSADAERWVEFVQGTDVKGREIATVISKADIKDILKGDQPPADGQSVEMLKGDDYLRVWLNKGGTNYLIHFEIAKGK